uniref:ATP synthase subunit C lysine N-methyltransferase isoform X2 n=1 Tax=Geotrypetes seraphini TaxID=260995 RepID=A0A6P8P8Z3_GEOSA|nr:ATP synthase subunit C lysine N-methyltransferase isoform X2 [Geotrypetes seraphini]
MSKVPEEGGCPKDNFHLKPPTGTKRRTWGLVVIAAAKEGFQAVGFELNPWLVWYSRYRAWREGVHHNTSFFMLDLWKVSFSQYTNVVIFGVPQMMLPLEKKLQTELQDNTRVIACRFPFPHWIPNHSTGEGVDTVWIYDSQTFKKANRECLKPTKGHAVGH